MHINIRLIDFNIGAIDFYVTAIDFNVFNIHVIYFVIKEDQTFIYLNQFVSFFIDTESMLTLNYFNQFS